MAVNEFFTPVGEHSLQLEVKRSQFITYLNRASTPSAAAGYVADVRGRHPQARHVCWAFIAGSPDSTHRSMSDDGEPSGTAGRPMLAVLEHSGLGEVVAAVVRYFGGIKLGTGGLQRAYSDSVANALAHCPTQLQRRVVQAEVIVSYGDEPALRRLVQTCTGAIEQTDYSAQVRMLIVIPLVEQAVFTESLANITAGVGRVCFIDGADTKSY